MLLTNENIQQILWQVLFNILHQKGIGKYYMFSINITNEKIKYYIKYYCKLKSIKKQKQNKINYW